MYPVITIRREFGSGGHTIGKMVAEKLGIQFYDSEIVEKVAELTPENSVSAELLLVKVSAKGIEKKNALLEVNRKYGARIVDVTLESFTLEMTGVGESVDDFINAVSEFGIIELARTGVTSLERGAGSFCEDI